MNFGAVKIDEDGTLQVGVYDVDGKRLYQQTLYPQP